MVCPSCTNRESIEWGGIEGASGLIYKRNKPETAAWVCPTCYAVHDYQYQRDLIYSGRWESADSIYWDNGKFVRDTATGTESVDYPYTVGLTIWSAYNPRQHWEQICRVHSKTGNDRERQKTFTNTWLGQYWEEDVVNIEPDPLFQRREDYTGVPDEVICITCGIDVQGDRLEAHYIGWGKGEESWSLDYRVYYGNPNQSAVWVALHTDLEMGIRLSEDTDTTMPVIQALVDSGGHATLETYNQVRTYGHRIMFACKGSSISSAPTFALSKNKDKKHKIRLVNVGTINAKNDLFARLGLEEHGDHFMHFPKSDVHDFEWFRQMTSEEKVRAKRSGRWVYVYEQIKGTRNEVLDTTVYALAAYKLAESRGRTRNRITIEGGARIKAGSTKTGDRKRKRRNISGLD